MRKLAMCGWQSLLILAELEKQGQRLFPSHSVNNYKLTQ